MTPLVGVTVAFFRLWYERTVSTSRDDEGFLRLSGVRLADIAEDPRFGTPAYVYDLDGMDREARELSAAFEGHPHLVAYAVKANSAAPILRSFARAGLGADVVSGGEVLFALGAGVSPDGIVMSGVAKTDDEIDIALASGPKGILAIQVESAEEVARVEARARAVGHVARVSLRINPGLDPSEIDTHANIATGHDEAKFGVPLPRVAEALARIEASPSLSLSGLTCHVGSQFVSTDAYEAGARVLFALARDTLARGIAFDYVDTGGGFGIDYGSGCPVRPADFVKRARALAKEHGVDHLRHLVEPGRSLVGAHGVLLTRVLQRKSDRDPSAARSDAPERRWLMIDAGMNDLMRPALYQSNHRAVPLGPTQEPVEDVRVVGPVCESSDDFGLHPLPTQPFVHLALLDAGAYGFSMASRYNGRPLPAEVFLRQGRIVAATERAPASGWANERLALHET
jgi:diaminopimelate decarboxylase